MAIYREDAPHVAGSVISVTIFAYITFVLRVYTRITRHSWGIEDWLMAAATLPFTMLWIACTLSAFHGIGVSDATLGRPENQVYYQVGLFWFFLFEVFYCVTIIPIKLSIAFMLVRIAKGRALFVLANYVVMAMFTVMNLVAAFYIIFQCWPVAAAWNTSLLNDGGHCNDPKILADIYYATTAVNIATDWFTALMPIPLLWNVKLNLNSKLSVGAILSLGVFASLSACIRLKYTVNLTSSTDYLLGLANIVIWGFLENGIGLFVGNLSTLRPLFRRVLGLGGSDGDATSDAHHHQKSAGHLGGIGGAGNNSAFPSQSRRTYKSFDTSFELGTVGGGAEKDSSERGHHHHHHNHRGGGATSTTQIRGPAAGSPHSPSTASDTDSQSEILVQVHARSYGKNEIMVSHHINVSRH